MTEQDSTPTLQPDDFSTEHGYIWFWCAVGASIAVALSLIAHISGVSSIPLQGLPVVAMAGLSVGAAYSLRKLGGENHV